MLQTEDPQGPLILIDNLVRVLSGIQKDLREKNTRIKEIQRAIVSNPSLLRNLEKKDIDKDGAINVEGFKATFLVPEIGLQQDEAEEIFYLICDPDGYLRYADWIASFSPDLRDQFENYSNREPKAQATISTNRGLEVPNINESSLSAFPSQEQIRIS